MIVVYGATGYTGRLVCARLKKRGLPFIAAGRDARKLEALQLGVETAAVDIGDSAGLVRLVARGSVVLDCAGPFARLGRAVQDAALAARRHFLDVTGEQLYMRETAARDAEARAAGVVLVNAVGFDVVPTDAAAALAALDAGPRVDEVRIAFYNRRGRPTQGTARSAVESMHLGGVAYVDGEFRGEPLAAHSWEVPFPEPFGVRHCASIPWGDVATAPRSTGARTVRCFMALSSRAARGMRVVSWLSRFRVVQSLAARYVDTRPEGPSDSERAQASFAVYCEARGDKGTHAVWVTGPDGYDFTAASAVMCAERAAAPGFAKTGALTPTQAFGARELLDGMAADGVRWGTGASLG